MECLHFSPNLNKAWSRRDGNSRFLQCSNNLLHCSNTTGYFFIFALQSSQTVQIDNDLEKIICLEYHRIWQTLSAVQSCRGVGSDMFQESSPGNAVIANRPQSQRRLISLLNKVALPWKWKRLFKISVLRIFRKFRKLYISALDGARSEYYALA